MRATERGFNLIELMLASAISLAVLAAAISAGVSIQRLASIQQETIFTQNIARLAKETLAFEIERAGAGVGGARINLGDSDNRHAIEVTSAATYSDSAWGAPSAAYASLISDGIDLLTADVSALVSLEDCNAGAGFRARNGINVCVADGTATALENRVVVFANPNLGVACVHKVTGSHVSGGKTNLQTGPKDGANDPPSSEPCAEGNDNFWGAQGGMVMEMRAVAFRVNWGASGDQPTLEFTEDSLAAAPTWEPLSRQVEQLRVRVGVADLTNPVTPLAWFPIDLSASPAVPAIDQCTAATCTVPGGVDALDPAGDLRSALLRRARLVELTITARSERRELSEVRPSGSSFEIDPETGYLRDGFRRRTIVVFATPRNATFAGAMP